MTTAAEHVYTPSELNREIKLHLEMGFPRVVLEAEISNLARPASGHLYFSLKDDKAQIRCAMFRSSASRMGIQVQNGARVLARGRISLYEARGDYQFIVDSMQDAGEGLLQRQFEELKKKLDSEGLFEPAHKKALPPYPARIGLITSRSGARWVIPKGVIDPGETAAESASREAHEEAGLVGDVSPAAVGSYEYDKWGGTCRVEVFLMAVREALDTWAESEVRKRRWTSPEKAARLVREPDLKRLIKNLSASVADSGDR